MSEEELIETLRAFEKNRVEQLEEPAKNLFYAIMKIADERDRLKEELKELNEIIEIGRKREYHSKFLKGFQKERGKNVFPDHDEIYKRYDDYKDRVEKAIKYIGTFDFDYLDSTYEHSAKIVLENILEILKGVDKE